jgi:hypothetical protein
MELEEKAMLTVVTCLILTLSLAIPLGGARLLARSGGQLVSRPDPASTKSPTNVPPASSLPDVEGSAPREI